jgi:hypothetical protein
MQEHLDNFELHAVGERLAQLGMERDIGKEAR